MKITREMILEILVRLKLEQETCKCERHAMDFYQRFSELVAEKVLDEVIENLTFDGYEHYFIHKDIFKAIFIEGEKNV